MLMHYILVNIFFSYIKTFLGLNQYSGQIFSLADLQEFFSDLGPGGWEKKLWKWPIDNHF